MKKIVAVAALVAASFAAPALPTQAATTMEEMDSNCWVFPMFKQECWEKAHDWFADRHAAAHAAFETNMSGLGDVTPPKWPVEWWNCTRAPEGSGHLLDC
jgi:hypothetical protein